MSYKKGIYPYTLTYPEWTHRKIEPDMLDRIRKLKFVLVADDYIGILRIICKDETISEKEIVRIEKILENYEDIKREA